MRRIVTAITAVALAFSLVAMATPANAAVAGYDSAYAGESAFLTLSSGQSGTFTVFFANTGATSWVKGSASQIDLAACLEDKVTCNSQDTSEAAFNSGWLSATRYATHTQSTVAPGQIGTFTYNVAVPAGTAGGTYRFNGALVLSSSGADIRNEGYYQDVTVPTAAASGMAITPDANAAATNTVSGSSPNENRGAHTYTATLTGVTSCVDIALFPQSRYTVSTGVFRDTEGTTDTADDNNQADSLGTGGAVIEVVNGVAVTASAYISCVAVPSSGIVTFTIDSTTVATDVRPVVFVDANNNDALDLNADNKPTETFVVGGRKTYNAAPADSSANAADGCVRQVNKDSNFFVVDSSGTAAQCADPTAAGGTILYNYDANDTFTVAGIPSTMADFEAALSRGDGVTVGAYGSSAELVSTFDIAADGPTLTSCTAEKGTGAGTNDIKISINPATPDYNTATIATYYSGFRIQRAPVTSGTDEATDGTVGTYATIATSTVDEDSATATVWEYTDADVAAGTYRYRCAGIVDGDTGPNAADPNNESSVTPGTADLSSPTSVDLRVTTNAGLVGQLDTGDVFKVAFSEDMNTDSTNDQIRIQDADGTTMTIVCGSSSTAGTYGAVCNFNTTGVETLGGTEYAANRVLTVTITSTTAPTVTGEIGTATGMQLPTTVIDQGGITDTTGNQWNVTGSADRVIDVE